MGVVGKRAGIRRPGNIAANGCVFRLGGADVNRGAYPDEFVELGRHVFVHAQATVGAGVGFHPPGMESVVSLELAPVGHGSALEFPSGGLLRKPGLDRGVAVIGVTVAVGTMLVVLLEDAEAAQGGGLT